MHFEDAVEPWQEGTDDHNAEDFNEIAQPLADLETLSEAEENSVDDSDGQLYCEATSDQRGFHPSPQTITPSEDGMVLSPILMKHIRAKDAKEKLKVLEALKIEGDNEQEKKVVISIHTIDRSQEMGQHTTPA